MTSQPGLQTSTNTYCPISQKVDQTMTFGQLIEYNKINIFPEKLCRK